MMIWLIIICYALPLFFLVVLGRFFLYQKAKKNNQNCRPSSLINLHELTVVVPFRNEEKNLKHFISSIECSTKLPKQFIFINDHSEDNSVAYLDAVAETRKDLKILHLKTKYFGKKHAIRLGMRASETAFVLLLDADVVFDSKFFEHLSTTTACDLIILPVEMQAVKWFQHFFVIDVNIANAVNEGMYGLYRPVMASGANMLVKRDNFLKWDTQSDFIYHGGDDLNILKDFIQNKAAIGLEVAKKYSVLTAAPSNLRAYISQRLRWIGNARRVKDQLNTILMLLQVGLTILYFAVIFYFLSNNLLLEALFLFCSKGVIDMIVFFDFFSQRKQLSIWILIPIYEVLFPVILFFLTLGSFFAKIKWKGRPLN